MITVEPAEPVDAAVIAKLTEEMDRFYGASGFDPLELRISQVNKALFSNPPSAYALLAWDDSELAGFASYSFMWPAVGLTRSLYLKELYVIERARQKGAGKLLMQRLYEIAAEQGCSRVEWTTDRDNPDARQFYAKLGVPVRESKLFYRVEGDELRR